MAEAVLAVVLAGGRARRMGGGDKALVPLGGRPLLAHVLARIAPQCAAIIVNANGDPARFAAFGLPVVADAVAGFPGPLAGILAGLDAAAAASPPFAHILSIPADTPFLPTDLVLQLAVARDAAGADIAVAASDRRRHPVVALWPARLREEVRRALTEEGASKVDAFAQRHRVAVAEWSTVPADPFFNVNGPSDLAAAEALLGRD